VTKACLLLLVAAVAVAVPAATAGTASRRAVPILMYHVIQAPPADAANPGLFVSKPEFAAQMRWLARRGFQAVTLRQVYRAWHGRGRLPRKPVVITFYDGYRSQYTHALPVLRAHGWRGVLNLDL
jgi:peptidoglycan/xylan/chitin deacetylase (PgdA/CDA1 family)